MKHARSTNQNPKCDPPDAKRIVIVDDHPLFRKGLVELIHSEKITLQFVAKLATPRKRWKLFAD
jgi:DNA-binding NarL/FixJ family response regulator